MRQTAFILVLFLAVSFGTASVVSAAHWQPGDGNPAADAAQLGDSFDEGVFADDWSPTAGGADSDMPDMMPDDTPETDTGDTTDSNDENTGDGTGDDQPADNTGSNDGDAGDGTDEETGADETDPSQEDIEAARQASEAADACTQEFAVMQSPYDPSVTFEASDGCMIAELEDRGWERVDTTDDTGDDTGDAPDSGDDTQDDEDTQADDGQSDSGDSTVTEERQVTPAPPLSDPYVQAGEDWISYPNPRDHMPNPETAATDPSVKVCAVMLNQDNEVITGRTVSDATITADTDVPYGDAQPVTFTLPIDQTQDLVGTSPDYREGDGMLDSECAEFHNLPERDYTYGAPTITGPDSDQIEFVGVTEYWDGTGEGDPFNQRVHGYGDNELSDGYIPPLEAGNYEQQHAEVVYLFRLT